MRRSVLGLVALFAIPLSAQTADDIVARYIKTTGGIEKINAVKSLRRTGKFTGGGGFEALVINENRRPDNVRQEFTFQGMTGVVAYDGKSSWKIEPWQGKKDPEPLGEEELKGIIEDSDFDGPLVNYQQKGNKVEYLGLEPVEGTDSHKLKVTTKAGDVFFYYMDTDYFVPIKIETQRTVRGEQREYETSIGDYKEVNGWYLPYSFETNAKGSSNKQKITYDKIEANVDLPDSRFRMPATPGTKSPEAPDASQTAPKKPETKQTPAAKPPQSVILSREDGEESQVATAEILRFAQDDGNGGAQ